MHTYLNNACVIILYDLYDCVVVYGLALLWNIDSTLGSIIHLESSPLGVTTVFPCAQVHTPTRTNTQTDTHTHTPTLAKFQPFANRPGISTLRKWKYG